VACGRWQRLVTATETTMFELIVKLIKWTWIPALLMSSILTPFADSYAPLIEVTVSLAAILLAHRAYLCGHKFWAAGLLAVVFVFSPLFIVDKIFLLFALACITTFGTLFLACRTQPELVRPR
jgi:hypothetical protein